MADLSNQATDTSQSIAIIGMAGRFPEAQNLDEFWENLRTSRECIRTFSRAELEQAGVRSELLDHPDFVPSRPYLQGIEYFDHQFFGFTPKEASIMDPQHRLLLETAWEAFECAGYNPEALEQRVAVFAGTGENGYLWYNLGAHRDLIESMGGFPAMVGNGKDYLASRLSYKLNLRGPSMTVQTACSTSLVAIHLGCQSLLSGESDMALAGAVSLALPGIGGYLYQDEGIVSSDGHCRSFDHDADGTLFGSGVGVVILKRLDDALRDRDPIQAVILGAAVNNDGAAKVGYTAPGVQGQADVIAEALGVAGVEPGEVGYVEAHGSATRLGDPIELRALNQAFAGVAPGQCALGSVKSSIGHVNTAAGMAGLMKTILAMRHRQIPASLNVRMPSKLIDWTQSPFYVNTALREWAPRNGRRIAGVSSFGLGGTNAHVVLEQAPELTPGSGSRTAQLLLLSARTPAALQAQAARLAAHLERHATPLADVAYTLQLGRKPFAYRRSIVATDLAQAVQLLGKEQPAQIAGKARQVAFMLPGVGERYAQTFRALYQGEPVFRQHLDRCCALLRPWLDVDLGALLWEDTPRDARLAEAAVAGQLGRTRYAQPALFAVEYSLAQLWMSWGVAPRALIGHSLGEYVAATLAGVFSLEDGLRVVAARARLIDAQPAGAMLAVPLSEADALAHVGPNLSLAAVNAPELCVLSGTLEAVAELEVSLLKQQVAARRLAAIHAFHSRQMEAVRPALLALLEEVTLHAPRIALMSNLSGAWLSDQQATDPGYWAEHMCAPVRFARGIQGLAEQFDGVLLEVGPQSVGVFARQQLLSVPGQTILASLPHPLEPTDTHTHVMKTLGKLWGEGVDVDWSALYCAEQRNRVLLPAYPFERSRHWIDALELSAPAAVAATPDAAVAGVAAEALPVTDGAPVPVVTEPAQVLLGLYRELLGLDSIAPHQSFFELGGHSLLAVQLISRVRQLFGVRLQLSTLFEAPSVEALLPLLLKGDNVRQERLDMFAEARLDDDIRACPGQVAPSGAPDAVLLTGATGFLGAFVLHELLEQTSAHIYCLIRAESLEMAADRLRANLRNYELLPHGLGPRVTIVLGDLTLDRFGLADQDYDDLARQVQAVYHVAAWVNWIYPYAALKQANVEGTRAVLRFAASGRLKALHHVSSTAVFDIPTYPETSLPDETFDLRTLDYSEGMLTGYAISKWVAEQLVIEARARGIPTSVYRAAYVAGHSRTGACNTGDFIYRMTKGCIELGLVPDIRVQINVAPVDFVARALVRLSLSSHQSHNFHVMNRDTSYWQDVIEWIGTLGYDLQRVSYDSWMDKLGASPENALYPLVPYLPEHFQGHDDGSAQGRLVDAAWTSRVLAELGLACPPADARLLAVYHRFMLARGYLSTALAPV